MTPVVDVDAVVVVVVVESPPCSADRASRQARCARDPRSSCCWPAGRQK